MIDPVEWLSSQTLFPKFYWRCRETGLEKIACGMKPLASHRYHVTPFQGPIFTFTPAIEIEQYSTVSFSTPLFIIERIQDNPSYETWIDMVTRALKSLRDSSSLQKVVLARKTHFSIAPLSSPWQALYHLHDTCPHTDLFAFQKTFDAPLFLGASPERLFLRQGRHLAIEALAGTRKRGHTLQEDLSLSQELLTSLKDQREISYIDLFIQEQLRLLCTKLYPLSSLSCKQTSTVQHLYRIHEGILRKTVTDEELLHTLHPTPAIGGLPKKKAFSLIHELEPFSRELYAGAIGWSTPEKSVYTVTIRSATLQGHNLYAFTGAGIVSGSVPELEWKELDLKLMHWSRRESCTMHPSN